VPCRFASRLTGIKENAKFQKKTKTKDSGGGGEQQAQTLGLKLLVEARARRQVRVRVARHGGALGRREADGGGDGALQERAGVPGAVAGCDGQPAGHRRGLAVRAGAGLVTTASWSQQRGTKLTFTVIHGRLHRAEDLRSQSGVAVCSIIPNSRSTAAE
jgi:hypothetical protein